MCPRLSCWGEWKTLRVVVKKGVERGQKYKGKREPPELPSVMRRGLGAILSPRSATRHIIQPCLSSLPCDEAHICPLKLYAFKTRLILLQSGSVQLGCNFAEGLGFG